MIGTIYEAKFLNYGVGKRQKKFQEKEVKQLNDKRWVGRKILFIFVFIRA